MVLRDQNIDNQNKLRQCQDHSKQYAVSVYIAIQEYKFTNRHSYTFTVDDVFQYHSRGSSTVPSVNNTVRL